MSVSNLKAITTTWEVDFSKVRNNELPIPQEICCRIINFLMNNKIDIIAGRVGRKASSRNNTIKFDSSQQIPHRVLLNTRIGQVTVKLHKIGRGGVKQVTAYYILNKLMYEAISKQKIENDFQKYYTGREVKILRELKGLPYLLQIISDNSYYSSKGVQIQLISTQLCDLGNLFDYHDKLSTLEKFQVFYKILKAIKSMHDKGILHRDIKLDNIFLRSVGPEGEEGPYPVLGDFGLACYKTNLADISTRCGTLDYMAPEIYEGEGASEASDAWSAGVVFHAILYKNYPFNTNSSQAQVIHTNIINYIQQSRKPENIYSADYVVWNLLRPANERMTIDEAMQNLEFFVTDLSTENDLSSECIYDQIMEDFLV
jgi:serine/threonine protein kinase